MSSKKTNVLDVVVVGTGLAGLNFIEKYLEKKIRLTLYHHLLQKSQSQTLKRKLNYYHHK